MNRTTFEQIILEQQEIVQRIPLVRRPTVFEDAGNYVTVGIRQAGKSYMLYQKIGELLENGHSPEEIVYINFDDERLEGITAADFDMILQAYKAKFTHEPLLFFDEIQNVDGWEKFARRLVNQQYRVYVTGSNAKMLSSEMATTLGGRYIMREVYPYDFAEHLARCGVEWHIDRLVGESLAAVRRAFDEYFRFGGFPGMFDYAAKRIWLNNIYNKILLGDIVARNGIKNERAIRLMVKRLAESVKQPVSCTRLRDLLKSAGAMVGTGTIVDYLKYCDAAYLTFPLENFASKFVERETVKKHYFTDNGLLLIFLTEPDSALLENLCAGYIHRQYGKEAFFWRTGDAEVDFYVPDEGLAVQACYSLSNAQTLEREVEGLRKLSSRFTLKRKVIVTYDESGELSDGIEIIPAWKWLLDTNH